MIPFSKYSGAGNDFVVVEATDDVGAPAPLARSLCPRSTGVGVDGLALVRRSGDPEVRVRFFNPDGSEFAVCGNGSRCVARWASDLGLDRDGRVTLETEAGTVEARVAGDEVTLLYSLDARVEGRRTVPFGGERREGWLVRTGTPHFVLPLDELPEGAIDDLCRPVRSHPALGPGGANVNLVAPVGDDRVRIRTFERGVEAETRACGAGAMSAALALHGAGRCGRRLRLLTRHGAELRVELGPDERPPSGRREIRLTGPARFVFRGRYPWPGGGAADHRPARSSRSRTGDPDRGGAVSGSRSGRDGGTAPASG